MTLEKRPLKAPPAFLVLPENVRPPALANHPAEKIARIIEDAPVPIFVTDELKIVAMNAKARPAFPDFPNLVGVLWSDFMQKYWEPDAAAEIIAIITKTLETGTPYSSIGYAAKRADQSHEESYDWEVHRIFSSDRKRMLVCYFVGRT